MSIVNLAAYRFVSLPDRAALREPLKARCVALSLRGTILLAEEGINLFIAGGAAECAALLDYLENDALFAGRFAGLSVKRSLSAEQPFRRMLVKLKKEIITMKHPAIAPARGRAPAVAPATLKRWLDQGVDDAGRPVVMLDTRNAFEVDVGTFEGALDWRLDKFSEFPEALAAHRAELEGKTVVSFCTGGIRCEKAGLYMQEIGVSDSYQLEGGILGYFEQVGGAHYRGDCFVFDHRTALDPALRPAAAVQCFACRAVLDEAAQASPHYRPGEQCPHCVRVAASPADGAPASAD